MEFGDLSGDKQVQEKLLNLHKSIDNIENILDLVSCNIGDFNAKDNVNYDLFISYSLNTLFWLYLRTKGIDPNTNDVKNELNRIRQYMIKAKQAHERNTIRPKVDQEAAQRFIKHGIGRSGNVENEPLQKKRKAEN